MAVLTSEQMRAAVAQGEYVEGVVVVSLDDLMSYDFDEAIDLLSTLLTGSDLLMDVGYTVAGMMDEQTLRVRVTGDAAEIVALMDEGEE